MTDPQGPGVHYPYGIAGGTHPGAVTDCPTNPCAQRRQDKANREAAEQAQLAVTAQQAFASAGARHDAIVRRRALRAAAESIRFSAHLREAEGETELAAYGRELADLINPPAEEPTP